MLRAISLALVIGFIFTLGCSKDKGANSTPPPPRQPQLGRISIVNNSQISVRIAGYTQKRGTDTRQVQLWVHIFPGQDFVLHNLIDPGQSPVFPGGDIVTVLYMADEPDPSNPYQPLFQDNVQLTVDGNLLIHVKSDGEYSISPG